MNKFPVLSFISLALLCVGWPLILAGCYFGIWEGLFEPNLPNHRFTDKDSFELAGGVFALAFGLVLVAIAECIKVLLAIEMNTRSNIDQNAAQRRSTMVKVPSATTTGRAGAQPHTTARPVTRDQSVAEELYPNSVKYHGQIIRHNNNDFVVSGKNFTSIEDAKRFIDGITS